ncbi:Hsp20 family protein, partial [Microbacterium aurugineum]|uniref:Hsp20 family protein n=1 Tax=Microbacterium aurugineum TaxID=2851642 RepID=UPI0039BE4E4D
TRNEYFKSPFQRWLPRDEGSSINIEEKKWQINVDVQHFTPEEVTVKINNGFVVVEGRHEEREDEHGYVMRHFTRRFRIPEDTNCNAIESRLSSDGVLSVLAPRLEPPKGEWNIPISHTGPVRTEIKDP